MEVNFGAKSEPCFLFNMQVFLYLFHLCLLDVESHDRIKLYCYICFFRQNKIIPFISTCLRKKQQLVMMCNSVNVMINANAICWESGTGEVLPL